MKSTSVRFVQHRGGAIPGYAIEVTVPGWRGVDAALEEEPFELPSDLKQIRDILAKANINGEKWIFGADGTTELVFEDPERCQLAVTALSEAGWLAPEMIS